MYRRDIGITIILILLVGCGVNKKGNTTTTPVQEVTRKVTLLESTYLKRSNTESIIPTYTSTFTNTMALNNEEPIIYLIYHSGDGPSGDEVCMQWNDKYSFALYQNGKVLKYYKGIALYESLLDSSGIKSLENWINNTGFQNVIGGEEPDIDDLSIYQNPPSQIGMGGGFIEIKVYNKVVYIYYPLLDYVIYPIKQTYNILTNYELVDKSPYIPKNISLVQDQECTFPPSVNSIIWPSSLKPPYSYHSYDGSDLPEILSLFGEYYPTIKPIIYDNYEYCIIACPNIL